MTISQQQSSFTSACSAVDSACTAAESELTSLWGAVSTAATALAAVEDYGEWETAAQDFYLALAAAEKAERKHAETIRRHVAQAAADVRYLREHGADLT